MPDSNGEIRAAPMEEAGPESRAGQVCRIRLRSGETFPVARNSLLLGSALAQGVNYPHSCRVGTCGRCKTRLVSGRISPRIDFALSPLTNQELKDGYILACQAKVRTDLEIDVKLIVHDVILPRMIAGRITGWERLPGDVIDLRVTLEESLHFAAGQYAALAISGSFVRRSFSFSDAPDPEAPACEVGFLVKHLPDGQFSDWLAREDRRGVPIWLEGPFGQMGLDDEPRDALCVAGGTGLAPVLAIAADRVRRFPGNRVTIIFGVRRAERLFALDRLQALVDMAPDRVRVIPVVSDEPAQTAWSGARGRVTDLLDSDLGIDFSEVSVFACGAPPMVAEVERRLLSLGVSADRFHADKFEPSGA
ncbi:MAG: 2Fe-2S iron-sulfur cluster binding domain-containing protein [Novosphingobium sp.]|nr:2Fe-2S iron-sulfur cluster binding domain-containing protein [Novosphingobium sp.]